MKSPTKSAGSNLKDVFQSVVEAAHHITALPVSIWSLNKTGTALKIAAFIGLPESYVRKALLRLDEVSVTSDVFRNQKSEVISDINKEPRWKYKGDAKKLSWKSVVCVPIITEGVTVGVLSAYAYTDRRLSDIRDSLSEYANQVALNLVAEKRRKTLESLLQISTHIRSITKNPKEVLDLIVRSVCETTGANCAVVYPYDMDREEFFDVENVSHFGLKKSLKLSDRPRTEKGMAVYIRRVSEVIITDIERDDPKMLKSTFIAREGIKAFMGIALKTEGDELGVLYVDYRIPHPFTEEEKETIYLFAEQASIAVHNSRLYQQALSRADDLEKIQNAGVTLLSLPEKTENLKTTLTRIGQNAQRVLEADLIDIYEYYQSLDKYQLPPVQIGKRFKPAIKKDEIYKDDIIWGIVNERRPRYVANAKGDKDLTKPFEVERPGRPIARFVDREKVLSTAAIPLIVNNEVMGVLFANYRIPQSFPDQHKHLIELFATQAAIVINNSRRIHTLQVLEEFGKSLTSGIRLKEHQILDLIRNRAKELMDTSNMYIALYDEATDYISFRLAYENGKQVDIEHEKNWQPRKAGKGRTEEIIQTKKPLFHATRAESEDWYKKPGRKEYIGDPKASWVGVPMIAGDKVLGVIATYNSIRDNVYRNEDLTVLQALADQAAIALDNSRMFYDINKRQASLIKFGQSLTSGIRLRETQILDLIRNQAKSLMDTNNMYIALYDEATDYIKFGIAYENGQKIDIEQEKNWQPRKAGKGKTEEIIRTKKPLFHATRAESEAWYKESEREEYVGKALPSWIGVPMTVGKKILGVIAIYHHRDEHVYDGEDLKILQGLGNIAAIALDNSKLYYEINRNLQNRINELETLQSIIEGITSEINLENLLLDVAQQAKSVVGAEGATIYRYDHLFKEFFLNIKLDSKKHSLPSIGGTSQAVIQEGKLIFANDAANDPILGKGSFVQETKVKSCMASPLMVGERCVGILFLNFFSKPHTFTDDEKRILTIISNQAALAIQTVGGLHDLDKQYKAVLKSIETAKECETIDQLLQTYLEYSLNEIGAQSGTIQLFDESSQRLTVRARVGKVLERDFQNIPLDVGITGQAAREKRTVYVPDIKSIKHYLKFFDETRSELAVPFMFEGTLLGVLNAEHRDVNAFNIYDRRLFELFASQASVLIRERIRQESLHRMELDARATQMTRVMAHNIKGYLGSARIQIDNVAQSEVLSLEQKEELRRADLNMRRCIKITQDLFKPYRPDERIYYDVKPLLIDATDRLGAPADINVEVKVNDDLPRVWIEANNAVDYFHEILSNGIRHVLDRLSTGEIRRGYIKISCRLGLSGKVEVRITNNGANIPKNRWKEIFDQFSGSSGNGENFGLGLWGAYTFFHRLGGSISVVESNEDHTTFLIMLPIAPTN